MDQLRFDGKVAIVTGGGRGVGRVHALTLAARGAKVVIADRGVAVDGSGGSNGPADEVVTEIKSAGGQAIAAYGSVDNEADCAAAVKLAVDTFGGLDILINNAGISDPKLFEDHTLEQFRQMVDVHYLGTVYMARAAWPHLIKSGRGRVVNTFSEGSAGLHPKGTAYSGAKGGVLGFTLNLATEGLKHGIHVNGFSPRISTRMSSPEVMARVYDRPKEQFAASLARFTTERSSPAAIYLAHDSCPFNGVLLAAGGGQVMRMALMENEGFLSDDISVESIAAHAEQILDMSQATHLGIGGAATTSPAKTPVGAH
jgi:NAD(P)-dependent dehydrogenase (short-subunit alcohol dehydrogenase family)